MAEDRRSSPEVIARVIASRVKAEKQGSRERIASRQLCEIDLKAWIQYVFAGKIWSL